MISLLNAFTGLAVAASGWDIAFETALSKCFTGLASIVLEALYRRRLH